MNEDMLDTNFIWELLDPHALIYLLTILMVFYIAKRIFDWLAPYDLNEQLTKADNKAVAVAFSGYLFAVGMILLSVLQSEEHGGDATSQALAYLSDIGATVSWCLGGIALMHIARLVNDKIIFHHFCNVKELVEDRNLGTGAAECGSFIGSGLIVHAALSGESPLVVDGIVSTLLLFITGQLFFVLFAFIYQKVTRFDLHEEIEKDNAAAGISAGMNLVAIGVLLSGYIKFADSLPGLAVWFVIAVFLLLTSRYMVDKLILPSALLDEEIATDQNWGAALIEGSSAIVIAFIINACFLG
ncbi:MAG: DUF350 domain-containing protein [Myxococcota bacterium]|nr:DUF350 domain-containing protein [Myxococcota bacterium]